MIADDAEVAQPEPSAFLTATAVVGVVVSKPMPKKTTSLSGFCCATVMQRDPCLSEAHFANRGDMRVVMLDFDQRQATLGGKRMREPRAVEVGMQVAGDLFWFDLQDIEQVGHRRAESGASHPRFEIADMLGQECFSAARDVNRVLKYAPTASPGLTSVAELDRRRHVAT